MVYFTISYKFISDSSDLLVVLHDTFVANEKYNYLKDKCLNTLNKYNPIIVEQTNQDESIIDYYDKLNNIMIDKIKEIINNK